ncbi:MAG: DUF2612 domain-containing protein [Rhodospirillaceae bacterium]|nr:MAG: DUF2612 domain-containing protein [Rhodospirillaceae bacterium]
MADISQYLTLVTSEHSDKPKFMALVEAISQPFVDVQNLMTSMPAKFDLDDAVGAQLDDVGEWVGIKRQLKTPLTGVFFSFDTEGLGFDQGTWKGPFDPADQLVSLGDEAYRQLIRAKILANQWDGTIPGAYAAYEKLLEGTGTTILIFDNCDMTMALGLVGRLPDPVTLSLITSGVLPLKPGGVRLEGHFVPSVPDTPFFGFDCQNDTIAGFDTGSWAEDITPVT